MRSAIFIFALLGAAWAFPKGVEEEPLFQGVEEEPEIKRLYVDPLQTIDDIVPRIVNGHEVTPHSIPYQAYLIVTDTDGSRWACGGSLISQRYVLTAAHCVVGGRSAAVYLGAHNLQAAESTRILITSTNLRAHENYDSKQISNDIGLIQLPSPVALNANVNVVQLPGRGVGTFEGRGARVSGWGLTVGNGKTSPVLREVNSTVIANPTCNSYYGIVRDSQVCISGAGGVASCNGDSGGPLVSNNQLIGIVSYGVKGCLSGYPSAFTRTSSFLDWISRHSDLKNL